MRLSSPLRPGLRVAATQERVSPSLPVLRALPTRALQAVGPFVFLDHVGPIPAPAQGVPAHPHAGIEVISYAMEGEIHHRDSFGNEGRIGPGGAQWITAGAGMLHAEQPYGTGPQGLMHGVQLWTRHPASLDDAPMRYAAVQGAEIPEGLMPGATVRLLCGTLPDLPLPAGPLALAQPTLLAHLRLAAGGSVALALPAGFELAVYGLRGAATVDAELLGRGELLTLADGAVVAFAALAAADLLVLGGTPLATPPVFGGPFVFDSPARLQQAYADYHAGKMGHLDGVP